MTDGLVLTIGGWARATGNFWYGHKSSVERMLVFNDDALHPIVGVVLLLIVATILRRSIANRLPWLILLALELLNEWADIAADPWPIHHVGFPNRELQFAESVKDVLLTMILPTILLLAARIRPGLFARPTQPEDDNYAGED